MNGPKNAHAHASFLLGVLPPAGLTARVEALRTRLGLRESAPHVTVKARSGLEADLGWILYWAHEEDYKWDSGWIVLENLPTDVHTAAHLIR